jgi:hypothetical protein
MLDEEAVGGGVAKARRHHGPFATSPGETLYGDLAIDRQVL